MKQHVHKAFFIPYPILIYLMSLQTYPIIKKKGLWSFHTPVISYPNSFGHFFPNHEFYFNQNVSINS